MELVNRRKDEVRPKPTDLGFIFSAVLTVMCRINTIEMHHVNMWPLFGPWKIRLKEDLWKLS